MTRREVRDHESGLKTLLIRRTYDAAPEDVWDALTDPDRIVRWFLPVTGDLRPGGRFCRFYVKKVMCGCPVPGWAAAGGARRGGRGSA